MNDVRAEWQIDCDDTIGKYNNVILSSPTGSGKTKRYELWALNKKERPIFITSPTKSLSNQRFRELMYEGYNVGLETGDIVYRKNDECDIICCTQEIYNNRYRYIDNSTLIIDEFSYIFEEEGRARAYIDSLKYTKATNILLCSGTFGNPEEVREYVEKVTNRKFFLYNNGKRLTNLEFRKNIRINDIRDSLVVTYSRENCERVARALYNKRGNYKKNLEKRNELMNLAQKYNINNEEILILCKKGIAYYYGGLLPKDKLFIEEIFERRLIDTVVGTDALALGVNFPIQNVIFTQILKCNNYCNSNISKNLFSQIAGRAGRKGYFDNGYVYYCLELRQYFEENTKRILEKENLVQAFNLMVNKKNEDISICLTPNIQDILNGITTIEEEIDYIVKYSTVPKNCEKELKELKEIIDYIKGFNLVDIFLKNKYNNLDFSLGYETALKDVTPKTRRKIDQLTNDICQLQPYFDEYIGQTYMIEYSYKVNCYILFDILMRKSLNDLVKKYAPNFRTLLLLRKYILSLPQTLASYLDISELDRIIDELDHTILHPDKIVMEKKQEEIPESNSTEIIHTGRKYKVPNYYEIIMLANGVEFVKVLSDDDGYVICEKNSIKPKLYYVKFNVEYMTTGVYPLKDIPSLFNKIDVDSLGVDSDIIKQKFVLEIKSLEKRKRNNTKNTKKKKKVYRNMYGEFL